MPVVEALAAFLATNNIQYAFGIGGHGNTPLLEAFMPYHKKNKPRVVEVQHEAVAAHAATALKWMHGIDSVVFTSNTIRGCCFDPRGAARSRFARIKPRSPRRPLISSRTVGVGVVKLTPVGDNVSMASRY